MSVKAGVSDTLIAIREKLRGKIGQTKVVRYWPGKAPDWARETEDDDDEDGRGTGEGGLAEAFPRHEDSSMFEKDDRRLRRVAESRVDDREEARADHRRIRQAEIISTKEEEDEQERQRMTAEGEEDEEAVLERRRSAIRERRLRFEMEEEAAAEPEEQEEEQEEEDESESEYETDSDEEPARGGGVRMVKPVFVPKAERETIAERERVEAEERAAEEADCRRREERRAETRRLVMEAAVRRSPERGAGAAAGAGDVETDDEAEEAEEYEAWKGREMGRVRREREERERGMREKEEMERVRGMSEEERREWERKNPKPGSAPAVPKLKWRFMQKYYHKGAFFQSDPDDPSATAPTHSIYARDFSAPTGEDKMDRTILPKVMQVKHFGRSGRTKWTHLVNEDTTDWNSPWIYNDPLRAKYNAKMAGMNAPIGRPKGSKKIKDWEQK